MPSFRDVFVPLLSEILYLHKYFTMTFVLCQEHKRDNKYRGDCEGMSAEMLAAMRFGTVLLILDGICATVLRIKFAARWYIPAAKEIIYKFSELCRSATEL